MTTITEINNPSITFYGPHPCDLCGNGPIVRGSVEQGFGDIRLDHPNEPIYPNHNWKEHVCGQPAPSAPHAVLEQIIPADDEGLKEFLRDSASLKTKVEHKWTAWMSDREDGIVGTGETEAEAIINLANAHSDRED